MVLATYTKYEGSEAVLQANAQSECTWKWWRYERIQGNLALIAYVIEEGKMVGNAFLLLRGCSYIRFDHAMSHARFDMGIPTDLSMPLSLTLPACVRESPCLIVMRNETDEFCFTCEGCTLYEREVKR